MGKRCLSAVILLGLCVPLILIGGMTFALFMMFLSLFGLYELLHVRKKRKRIPFLLRVFAYLMVAFLCLCNFSSNPFYFMIDYRVMAFLIFIFLLPLIFVGDSKKYDLNDALFLIGSVLFLGLSFNLLIVVRNYSLEYIVYLFLITTITDTFAFLTGKYIGVTPLAKTISPNKTIEGLIGGLIMGVFVATVFYIHWIQPHASIVFIVFITLLLAIVGQLGDLVFSFIKRFYEKKDFSSLIPGHGGVLDRFDSMIFVVLAFALLAEYL